MTKRTLMAAFAAIALAFSAAAAQAAEYRIDAGHSFVQFKISHIGVSWMIGTFDTLSGSFSYDPDAGPEGAEHLGRDRHGERR